MLSTRVARVNNGRVIRVIETDERRTPRSNVRREGNF